MGRPEGGKTNPRTDSPCELVICVDPETGHRIVRPRGKCPRKYLEEVKRDVATDGLYFPPAAMFDDEDEK